MLGEFRIRTPYSLGVECATTGVELQTMSQIPQHSVDFLTAYLESLYSWGTSPMVTYSRTTLGCSTRGIGRLRC